MIITDTSSSWDDELDELLLNACYEDIGIMETHEEIQIEAYKLQINWSEDKC